MLTGRHLLFVGGDARQLEVISQVSDYDATATLVGLDDADFPFADGVSHSELNPEVFAQADALVLPVAGTDDKGSVSSQFCSEPIVLREAHFAAMRPGSFVFSGIARPYLEEQCQSHGLNLIKLMELDEVAILNSIPTAEGALCMAMKETDITIHSALCTVLGFGRVGQTLARTLHALGAKVQVVSNSPAQLARIKEMGLRPIPIEELEHEVDTEDVIFNTIPTLVLTASVLRVMKQSVVIIDIASKPGGTDFRYAERRKLKALLVPSLPGQVAPKTAGKIIAKTLSRILSVSDF
ncbi:dipicolinate synthase subunit DpsA [Alicyclobacillus sp. SO9]|uniref:dipicolinate synthase subunit DpsA n=1 Tax=Alicyclobacillus sp. SO9 TaxID=2665646 RepID=UPI0018E8174C|nr:dipicolinate synthase subunit DpsA [Alicyclobacillus sp. SO9]QQE80856.1 dipicolinate synthase subunit DpsA [Alicyclobacillus sp. SO9]